MDTLFFTLATLSYYGLTLYEWIIIIAILISWVHPDPNNPIIRFLNGMTRPVWDWIATRLPTSLSHFAAYFSLLLVWFLIIFAPGVFHTLGQATADTIPVSSIPLKTFGFFLLGLGVVLRNLLFFIIILLLIWFFLTLVNPSINNPIVRTIFILVDPFITPLQKWLPRSKVDFSPLVMAGMLAFLNVVAISGLIELAAEMTNGGLSGFQM